MPKLAKLSPAVLLKLLRPFNIPSGTTVLVAVSGGADSMVLLDLLTRIRRRLGITVVAAHVNHQLRPESPAEERAVHAFCATHAVPLSVLTWPVAAHPVAGVEAAAREFRYAALARVATQRGAQVVLTAHHRDDQVESVLFALTRSGSVAAAAGIRPERAWRGRRLIRPLLTVTRAQLRAYARAQSVPFFDDASNADTNYSRNYLRHVVLPALRAQNPELDAHVARFATELAGTRALAEVTIRHFLPLLGPKSDEMDWAPVQTESYAVQQVILTAALERVMAAVTSKQVRSILDGLLADDGQTRTYQLTATLTVTVRGFKITIGPPDVATGAETLDPIALVPEQVVTTPVGRLIVTETLTTGDERLSTLPEVGELKLRHRVAGDFVTLSNGHHQKVRRLLINQHVPTAERAQLWLVAAGHEVFWIQESSAGQLFQAPQTAKIKAKLVKRTQKGD